MLTLWPTFSLMMLQKREAGGGEGVSHIAKLLTPWAMWMDRRTDGWIGVGVRQGLHTPNVFTVTALTLARAFAIFKPVSYRKE